MHFWQDLWEPPRRRKTQLADALDVCIAIELAVGRFYSINDVEFWDSLCKIVQSTVKKIDLLDKLETELAYKMHLNGVKLRPFRWEDISGKNKLFSDQLSSITQYIGSVPAQNFVGDFLGQIYQNWESEGTKTGRGSYYTSETLARNLIQTMDIPAIQKISIKDNHKKLIICDPACGSGVFFLEFFRAMNSSQNSEKIINQLEIHGFDTDPIAVWICRLNLIIWAMFQPAIAKKLIELRNALTEDSSVTREYDVVMGNPPFFEVPAGNFPALLGSHNPPRRVNISALFVLKYAPMLRDGGGLGFIFPRAFLFSGRWTFLRQFLSQGRYYIPHLTLYNRGFAQVGLEQIAFTMRRGTASSDVTISEYDDVQASSSSSNWSIPGNLLLPPPLFVLPLFATPDVRDILGILWKNAIPLGDFCDFIPKTSEPAIFRGMGWERHLSLEQSVPSWPALKGTDINPFGVKQYRYIPRQAELMTGKSARLRFIFERPVVVCQRLVSSKTRVVAARLPPDCVPISTLTCICLPTMSSHLLPLLLCALNSTFMSYYVADHVFLHSRLSTSLDKEYMRYIPIPNAAALDPTKMRSITNLESRLALNSQKKPELLLPQDELQELDSLIFGCYGLSEAQGDLISQKLHAFWNRSHRIKSL